MDFAKHKVAFTEAPYLVALCNERVTERIISPNEMTGLSEAGEPFKENAAGKRVDKEECRDSVVSRTQLLKRGL